MNNMLAILIACLSYTTIIAFCYTIFWGLTRHLFVKLKIYYEIFLGFVLGFISTFSIILITLLKTNKDNLNLSTLLPVFLYWVSIIFISPFSTIGIFTCNMSNLFLFSFLIPEFFGKPVGLLNIVILVLAYIIPLINYLFSKFWKKISNWSIWSINTICLLIVGVIINFTKIKNNETFTNLANLLFWLGSGYLAYAFIAIIDQTYMHALKLKNIVVYNNNYYLNFSSAHSKILEKIQKLKTKHGIYLTYFISNFDKFEQKVNNKIKEQVVDSFSKESYELINKSFANVVFFKPNYKIFAAFIPFEMSEEFDKTNNKYLKIIEEIFEKIKKNFKIDNFKISITTKAISSYYGIHSNNLDTLLEFNLYVSNNLSMIYKEKIIIVNPMEIIKQRNQNKKILSLNEVVNLNQYVTLFEPIYNCKNQDYEAYFLNGMISGIEINSELFKKQAQEIEDMGLDSLFIRYTAFQNLKKLNKLKNIINKKCFFLDYDIYYLSSEEFDLKKFLFKINNLKINLSEIIINFDLKKEINDSKILEKNLELLRNKNIKFSVSNFGSLETDFKLISSFKPNYIFLENDILKKISFIKEKEMIVKESLKIAKKIEAKLIATGVKSYIIYKCLKALGIEFFSGELIGSSIDLKENISEELKYLLNK